MNYTIATLMECNMGEGHLHLNIDKSGNEYLVGLYNDETREYTHRTFNSIDEAMGIFQTLSEWIIKSYYTEQQKRNYLVSDKVD